MLLVVQSRRRIHQVTGHMILVLEYLALVELARGQVCLHSQLGCDSESPRVVITLLMHRLNRRWLAEAVLSLQTAR